jgi:hypothetical protein
MTDVVAMTAAAWSRCRAVVLTASVVAVLAGCSIPASPGVSRSLSPSGAPNAATGRPVVLHFGDHAVAATLTDTPPARQFAAMLPLTVQLKDVWGQAKSGPLPHALTTEGSTPIHDPTPGDIYFWPQTDVIAIYYDNLGQQVPDPGLILLGIIDNGLDSLARAGRRLTVRIELAAANGS